LMMAVAMMTRKGFLYLAPIMIGISWRFAAVTEMRNFTLDELLTFVALIKIIQETIFGRLPSQVPVFKWYIVFLGVAAFTSLVDIMIDQTFNMKDIGDVVMLQVKERYYFPIVYLAVYILVRTPEEGLKLLRWTAFVAIPISIYSIIQYHFFIVRNVGTYGSFWLFSWYSEQDFWMASALGRAFGTLSHPSILGRYLMFSVVLGIVMAIHTTQQQYRRLGLAVAVLSFYAMGVSGSRGPMLGLAVTVGLLFYLERRLITRNILVLMILASALSFAVPDVMAERMGTFVKEGKQEVNVDSRFQTWQQIVPIVLDENPITGLGPQYLSAIDSDFINMFAQGGVVLFFAFLVVLGAIGLHGYAGILWGDSRAKMVGVVVICCTFATIGAALSGQTFFSTKVGLDLFFILGVCNKIISISLEVRLRERRRRAAEYVGDLMVNRR